MPMLVRYQASSELVEWLAAIAELSGAFERAKRENADLWPIVQKKLKVRWTADSNAIEGSTLTFAETLFFLEQGLTVEGKPLKDFLDARNHADAIDYLMQVVRDKRPLTAGLLRELNALLLAGVKSATAFDQQGRRSDKPATPGEYKSMPNHVLRADGTIHRYVDPVHVAAEIDELVAWVDREAGQLDPIVVAAIAHYNLVRIHPFDEGNGRGARLLMNLILMKAGQVPAVIRNEERRRYIDALRAADDGQLGEFILFIAHAAADTLGAVIADLQRDNP
jgi:Fic family protein